MKQGPMQAPWQSREQPTMASRWSEEVGGQSHGLFNPRAPAKALTIFLMLYLLCLAEQQMWTESGPPWPAGGPRKWAVSLTETSAALLIASFRTLNMFLMLHLLCLSDQPTCGEDNAPWPAGAGEAPKLGARRLVRGDPWGDPLRICCAWPAAGGLETVEKGDETWPDPGGPRGPDAADSPSASS